MNGSGETGSYEKQIIIFADGKKLKAIMGIPPGSKGLVIFAHGSGSSRLSPRNNYVAHILQESGLATLLADLLEEAEASDRRKVFDIDLLADRLLSIVNWTSGNTETRSLISGYFGASTGAGAALQAAAREPGYVKAVVSRGGRPDLAMTYLPSVKAPTLFIVGGYDEPVISMNEAAYAELNCEKKMFIIPGATHLFEEPGALEKAAELASDWFAHYLADNT